MKNSTMMEPEEDMLRNFLERMSLTKVEVNITNMLITQRGGSDDLLWTVNLITGKFRCMLFPNNYIFDGIRMKIKQFIKKNMWYGNAIR